MTSFCAKDNKILGEKQIAYLFFFCIFVLLKLSLTIKNIIMNRRRLLMNGGGGKVEGKEDAVAGDILIAKSDGKKMIVSNVNDIPIEYTPIGIVIIPPSHDVYGTGEGAAMSLKYMSPFTPDTGAPIGNKNYGRALIGNRISSIKIYERIMITGSADSTNQDFKYGSNPDNSYTCPKFASDYKRGEKYSWAKYRQCNTDPEAYWEYDLDWEEDYPSLWQVSCPSPYLNGGRNPTYYDVPTLIQTSDSGEFISGNYNEYYNALSDFSGKETTAKYYNSHKQSNWKVSSQITNKIASGYYPAAACCWRYHTPGTNQGDWYIPALGELGYYMARYNKIKNTYTSLINKGYECENFHELYNAYYVPTCTTCIVNTYHYVWSLNPNTFPGAHAVNYKSDNGGYLGSQIIAYCRF